MYVTPVSGGGGGGGGGGYIGYIYLRLHTQTSRIEREGGYIGGKEY